MTIPIRLLVVSPYPAVRVGLRSLLASDPQFQIVGEAACSEEGLELVHSLTPDAVLFDSAAGHLESFALHLLEWDCAAVFLVAPGETLPLQSFNRLRGWGAVAHIADGGEIAAALIAANQGLCVLNHNFMELLALSAPSEEAVASEPLLHDGEMLTNRELETLQLMAQGLPNKVIATRLNVTLSTAKFHVASILTKLGAASRTEAVTTAVRLGYIKL